MQLQKKKGRKPVIVKTAKKSKAATVATVKKIVRAAVKDTEEIKRHAVTTATSGLFAMYSDTPYTCAPLQGIALGTNPTQRVGSEIQTKWLKIRARLYADQNYRQCKMRIIVLESPDQFGVGTSLSSGGLTVNDLFIPGTFPTGNAAHALLDTKSAKVHRVLADKIFTATLPEAQGAGMIYLPTQETTIDMSVKLPKEYYYLPSGYNKDRNLYIVCIPHIPGATAAVDYVPFFSLTHLTTWTDA